MNTKKKDWRVVGPCPICHEREGGMMLRVTAQKGQLDEECDTCEQSHTLADKD